MTVLGIHDGHDAGAVLIRDWKVLVALWEEGPRNIKYYNGTPECLIGEVFRIAKVDLIVVGWFAMTHSSVEVDAFKCEVV